MNDFLTAFNKYSEVSGRSRRREYWMYTLVATVIAVVLDFFDRAFDLKLGHGEAAVGMVGSIFSLITLIPTVTLGIRRLHDTGRSGWWVFIVLIPVAGWIAYFIFSITDSQPGANTWGPNPKGNAPVQSGTWG
ncbi:MAG: hypothetical protein JWQ08_1862 [Deinococcus sp.]|nr:hypothetical protein [Deinococcus sp.]